MSAPPRTQRRQRVHLWALERGWGHSAGRPGAAERLVSFCPLLQRAIWATMDAQGGFALSAGEVWGSKCFLGCCSAQPAVSPWDPLPRPCSRQVLPGLWGSSSSSPVKLTLCCGQVPPSRRIPCISWKRYEDCVGEKMLQAGPDPLNDTPRCLWGQWRGSKPPQHSPAWQIRAGVRVAGCSPGHVPEGCVWPAVH